MAFCHWLSAELESGDGAQHKNLPGVHNPTTWTVRLPTEQEWQRAAVGDSGWRYPWGDQLDETRGNYGRQVGHPTRAGSYSDGKSPYQVMDMMGNVRISLCALLSGNHTGPKVRQPCRAERPRPGRSPHSPRAIVRPGRNRPCV